MTLQNPQSLKKSSGRPLEKLSMHTHSLLPHDHPPQILLKSEEDAEDFLISMRWPKGVCCPHCAHGQAYALRSTRWRRRRFKCVRCRKQFSVTKGTILEGSKLGLRHWIHVLQFVCENPEGVSIVNIQNELGVSYKAAQNLFYRLQYAAKRDPLNTMLK